MSQKKERELNSNPGICAEGKGNNRSSGFRISVGSVVHQDGSVCFNNGKQVVAPDNIIDKGKVAALLRQADASESHAEKKYQFPETITLKVSLKGRLNARVGVVTPSELSGTIAFANLQLPNNIQIASLTISAAVVEIDRINQQIDKTTTLRDGFQTLDCQQGNSSTYRINVKNIPYQLRMTNSDSHVGLLFIISGSDPVKPDQRIELVRYFVAGSDIRFNQEHPAARVNACCQP